jgi:8-oxo-dGTP diphosphatase
MMEQYAYNIIVVFCYLVRGDKVLLVQRAYPPHQGEYTIVGGKKEPGEGLLTACKREVLEETGLVVGKSELRGSVSCFIENSDYEVLCVYFLSEDFSGELKSGVEGQVEWCDIESSYNKPGISEFYKTISPHVFNRNHTFFGSILLCEDRIAKADISFA